MMMRGGREESAAMSRSVVDRKARRDRSPALADGPEASAAADPGTRRAVQEIFADPAMEQMLHRALAAADAPARRRTLTSAVTPTRPPWSPLPDHARHRLPRLGCAQRAHLHHRRARPRRLLRHR